MWFALTEQTVSIQLLIGRVDKASATELVVDSGSISQPGQTKLIFTAYVLDAQREKGQHEASTKCDRQVGRWQLDS